jgi:hypothetical protein
MEGPMRRLLKSLLLLAALAATLAAPALGQGVGLGEADRQQIRQIIQKQLNAFQKDDGALAFSYATPMIHDIFRTPENFMAMVKGGYLPVYRPREVEFRDIVDVQGQLTQRVRLVGPDGKPVIALYFMERQPDGSWLINGCMLTEDDDTSV